MGPPHPCVHTPTRPLSVCTTILFNFLVGLANHSCSFPRAPRAHWRRFPFPYSRAFHFLLVVASPRSQVKCCRWLGWERGVGLAGELRATIRVSWLWTRLAGAAVVEGCTGFAFHLLCFNPLAFGSPRCVGASWSLLLSGLTKQLRVPVAAPWVCKKQGKRSSTETSLSSSTCNHNGDHKPAPNALLHTKERCWDSLLSPLRKGPAGFPSQRGQFQPPCVHPTAWGWEAVICILQRLIQSDLCIR